MKRFFLLATVAFYATTVGAVTSTPSQADASQQSQNQTYARLSEDSLYAIQQIEVNGVRAKHDEPIAFSAYSREQIESRNYGEDIPSILANMPSVVISSESGTGIGATSFRVRGSDPSRINVTLNGVPMNDAETHSVYWYDTPDLISSVGSLQLQRGVGTSTAGTGAFGASLNMTSAPISAEFAGRASMSYGSFNTAKQELSLASGLLGGHWAVEGRLSHVSSDGYVDRASSDLASYMFQAGYYKGGTMVKLLSFGGKAKVYLTYTGLSADQMEENRRYNPEGEIWGYRPLADGTHEYAVVGFYDDHTDNYTQVNNQLIFNHIINDKWQLNATAHYTYGNGYYRNYKNDQKLAKYGLAPIMVDGSSVSRTNLIRKKMMVNDFGGLVASANYTADRLTLTMGVAASLYDGVHYGEVSGLELAPAYPTTEYYRNYTTKWDASCYVKADWLITNGLKLYGDLQYRHITHRISGVNDNFDDVTSAMQRLDVDRKYNFFNPKLGLHYTFARAHSVYASAAVGQKEPTRNNFTDIREGEYPTAEKMLDIEAGYGYRGSVVDLSLNGYYMLYRDQLVQTGELSDTGELLSRNVPESFRRGIEMAIEVRAAKWLTLGANATLSQNYIENYVDYIDGVAFERGRTTIAYSPSVTAGAFVDLHAGGFAARLSTRYVSKQYLTNGEYEDLTLPRYCVSDLDLSYETKTKRIERVRFGVKIGNLFNAKYCASGYGGSWLEGATLADRKSWSCYFPQATISALGNVTLYF
ncbi:MAG: TonB-dependent receptor [Rikenellaceae bacterium]|nr:TonB-dependent receptor [Rikenellaceae bacterium]